jgi:hypothetical protein
MQGKPGYPFAVTIDGQTLVWREDGEKEVTRIYNSRGIRASEGGEGGRYLLERKLRLDPGLHRVRLELPGEEYEWAGDVKLEKGGTTYVLELKPQYKRTGNRRPTFLYGVSRLEGYLNGTVVAKR